MSEKLLSTLFRPQTLLILQQADGTPTVPCGYAAGSRPQVTLQGYITHCTADTITLACTDGTTRQLTAAELANASYLYIGFPTMQAEVEVPQPLKGNATIEKIMGTIATLRLPDGQRKNVTWNFTDKELKLKASANPVGLTGLEVLFVTRESGNIPKSHLLAATTLDQALNDIAQIAAEGKRELALDFSRLLLQQFPDDSDILNYIARLTAPDEAAADERTDFYAPFPKPDENMLAPMGRIYEVNYRGGYIIDVNSHEKLFFFKEQLLDRLEKMSDKQLVGQPVVYSITRSKDKKSFQARSILMPMDIEDTYRVAEDMHYNDWGLRVTAYDILRIIDQQFNEEGIKDDLLGWRDNKVRNELWDYVTPPPYSGPTTQLYLPAPAQTSGPAVLLTHGPHTVMAPSEDYLPPEAPTIFFGPLPAGKGQPQEEPAVEQEPECLTGEPLEAAAEEHTVQPQLVAPKEEKKPVQTQSVTPKEEEEPEETKGAVPVTDEEIDRDPDRDKPIRANATLSYGYGAGVLHSTSAGDSIAYAFSIDDIIDEELRTTVRERSMSTSHVKDRKVVARLDPFTGRATSICEPRTVGEMLRMAKSNYEEALRLHDMEDDETAEDSNNDLLYYRLAKNQTETALTAAPTNALAIRLVNVIEKSISSDVGNYYKAPMQALTPLGEVWCVKTNGAITIHDSRFNAYPILSKAYIADRDYDEIRRCDQLTYALYWDARRKKREARFVVLARTEEELLHQAKEWLGEKELVKAWGIARQVLESNEHSEEAARIVKECEAATDSQGLPLVTQELKGGWNQPVTDNLFARTKQQNQSGKIDKRETLNNLLLYIQELESQHRGSNNFEIHGSINFCLKLYHELLVANPNDVALRTEYNQFGRQHGLYENREREEHYSIRCNLGPETIDFIIQFHIDMGNDSQLVKAYKKQIEKLSEDEKMALDEKSGRIATSYANIAWTYLRRKDDTEAVKYKNLALRSDPTNSLARVCNAVLEGRIPANANSGFPFSRQRIISLNEWYGLVNTENGFPPGRNLVAERFGLLCAIIQTTEKEELLKLLARFLSTLICNETEYGLALQEGAGLPADCWFVQQLNECLRLQQNNSWRGWMDVRLVAMLSMTAADCICDALFNLDRTAAHDILMASGVEVKYSGNSLRRQYFREKCFEEWRGSNYQGRFVGLLNQTDRLSADTDLNACAQFLRNLRHESWMQQTDSELISALRQQLPDRLVTFASADNSRQFFILRERILKDIAGWISQMEHRPTVLALTSFHSLLLNISRKVEELFAAQQFSQPTPAARLLQTSAISADGTMTIEVEVTNDAPFAYAMSNCQLTVANPADEMTIIAPPLTYDDASSVYGGEKLSYIIKVKTGPWLRGKEKGMLQLKLSFYPKESEPVKLTVPFPISNTFKAIDDQYATGGIAFNDFYGRENDIHKVLSLLVQEKGLPHFIIYGQKRCGKSSILHHIKERVSQSDYLKDVFGYTGQFVCIGIDFLGYIDEIECENDIYYKLWSNICMELMVSNLAAQDDPQRDTLPDSLLEEPEQKDVTFDHLVAFLVRLNKTFEKTRGWNNHKLLLFIDEFTSVLQWLQKGIIQKGFMQRWKVLQTRQLFAAVLIGQDVLDDFKRIFGAANALQGFDGLIHLNYLDQAAGRQLVTLPMIRATGNSDIFKEGAVDRILYYSASSPYYTRWICAAIVAYMNLNRLGYITTADVECAVSSKINTNAPSANELLFNPLTYPGQDLSETNFKEEDAIDILDKVAKAEMEDKEKGCNKAAFEGVDAIIQNLKDRMVLKEEGNYYKINVKLYMLWTKKRYGIV